MLQTGSIPGNCVIAEEAGLLSKQSPSIFSPGDGEVVGGE